MDRAVRSMNRSESCSQPLHKGGGENREHIKIEGVFFLVWYRAARDTET